MEKKADCKAKEIQCVCSIYEWGHSSCTIAIFFARCFRLCAALPSSLRSLQLRLCLWEGEGGGEGDRKRITTSSDRRLETQLKVRVELWKIIVFIVGYDNKPSSYLFLINIQILISKYCIHKTTFYEFLSINCQNQTFSIHTNKKAV